MEDCTRCIRPVSMKTPLMVVMNPDAFVPERRARPTRPERPEPGRLRLRIPRLAGLGRAPVGREPAS
jgi:hypothetical protein